MKNNSQNEISSKFIKLTPKREKDNKLGKLFLKNFVHKNTTPSNKIRKEENNIFPIYKNNPNNKRNSKVSSNDNNNSQINNNSNIFSYGIKSSHNLIENFPHMSTNLVSNSFNLKNYFNLSQKSKKNNMHIFPYINSYEKSNIDEKSVILKKDNKDIFKKSKFFNNNNKIRRNSVHDKSDKESKVFKLSRKYIKMKTFLDVNKEIDLLTNENKLNKEIEESNNVIKKNEGKGALNQKLLYSKKFNNYIVKIYKAVDHKPLLNPRKNKKNELEFYKTRNKDKSPKYYIMDYLNSFDPKKSLAKIKDKIKIANIGNPKRAKKLLLDEAYENLEYLIYKKNKIFQHHDILEKIKDKNQILIRKKREEYIQKIINEILLKINFNHKKTILNIHLNNIIISQVIDFNNHIKLNIMRHVLTKSEKDENLYFINLIKHFLYSGNKLKFPLIKSFRKVETGPIYKSKTIEKFIEFNNKKIYYLYFSIKFQLLDCETILKSYDTKKSMLFSPNKAAKGMSIIREEKDESFVPNSSVLLSTLEKRMKINHSHKRARRTKRLRDRIKYFSPNKILMDFNLTKNIINLRNSNAQEELKNRYLNLKKLTRLFNKNKRASLSSSDSFEYKKKSQKAFRRGSRMVLFSDRTVKEDNEEIHQRDKALLFGHFFSCVKVSQYDKLINILKRFSKYIDLTYKQDNGDTLLHLCVRHSLPFYFYKFLVNHGVNINSQNNEGDTVLHLAAKAHKYKLIDLLIKLGASEYICNQKKKNCWECL